MSREPLTFPADDWRGWLDTWSREHLAAAAAGVAALKQAAAGDTAILDRWNDVLLELMTLAGIGELLGAAHPDPVVLSAAEELETEVVAFRTDLHLDAGVHAQLLSLSGTTLDPDPRRVLDLALRDLRRAGVDRDEEVRARLRELNERVTRLEQVFMRNIREGRPVVRVPAAVLAGMPDDFVGDHPTDDDGLVSVNLDVSEVNAILRSAHDAEGRRVVTHAFYNRGYPANVEVLADLVKTRHDKAQVLGYPGWPDYQTEPEMCGSAREVEEFLAEIAAASRSSAERDVALLRDRAAREGDDAIDMASWQYWFEVLKREEYGLDNEAVRRYFELDRVRDGLLGLTAELFGLSYRRVPTDVASWHSDVVAYDMALVRADGTSEPVGRVHLDLHPRPGKRGGAAAFETIPGMPGRQLAEAVLVCSLPRGLMDHRDVVTFFHEFGHLVQVVLAGRQNWVRFSGYGTEEDFGEAPSQLLEEWAWDADVLRRFAMDERGEPIPVELVQQMRHARDFGRGLVTGNQVFYSMLALRLHAERPGDLTQRMVELYDEYSPVRALPDTHFFCLFHHLVNYSSGYYTYLWSLVIAKDMFSAFDPDDLLATEVARRYRDTVLVPGASKDAGDLVAGFLGRPYDTRAFTDWLDR